MSKTPVIFKLFLKLPNRNSVLFWIISTTIAINSLSLIIPVFFIQIFDRIIPNNSTETLFILALGAIILIIFDSVLIAARGFISSWNSSKYSLSESNYLMKTVYNLSNSEYSNFSLSEYFESFRSIDKLKKIYSGQNFQSLVDIPFSILFIYGIYYVAGKIVFFHISIIVLYLIINIIYNALFLRYKRESSNSNNKRFDYLRDILNKIHPIKSLGLEEIIFRKLELIQESYSHSYFLMRSRERFPQFLGEFTAQIMIYGTIVIGGILFIDGKISIGILSATTMLARRAVGPLLSISKLSSNLSEAKLNFKLLEKYEKLEQEEREELELPEILEGYLSIKDLTIEKNNKISGNLRSINFTAEAGFLTGIITQDTKAADLLVDSIIGIEKPDRGDIILDSIYLNRLKSIDNINGVSIIPRNPELFNGSIIDNITLFDPKLYIQALDTAAFLGLNPLVAKLPLGYETSVTSSSKLTLPSSLIHRISIARALVKRPSVIISNQAYITMNEETKNMYFSILDKLVETTNIIMFSDNLEILNKSKNLYLLNDSTLTKLE